MIGTTISHYRIVSQFANRGMGVVYDPENLKLHRHVVLNWFEELKQKVPTGKN